MIAFYNDDPKIAIYNATNFVEISQIYLENMNLITFNFIEKTDLIVIFNMPLQEIVIHNITSNQIIKKLKVYSN